MLLSFRLMKFLTITLALLLADALVCSAQSPLDRRYDFEVHDLPLIEAIEKLIEEAGVNLNFSSRIIPSQKRITISGKGMSLSSILDAMLSDVPVSYTVIGSQIVLYRDYNKSNLLKTITGSVSDGHSGERIVGALVYEPNLGVVTTTNEFGFFNLKLPGSDFCLVVNNLGYQADTIFLKTTLKSKYLEIFLDPIYLHEIVVKENPDSNFMESRGSGDLLLNIAMVSRLVSLSGEGDVFRIAANLPGLTTGADGFGGISVRGGSIDQNLFLLDGVPVYNATHGIGMVSVFNTSALKSARLLKGGFPVKYEGRLSSVWDIQVKEGNNRHFEGELDLGITSGKLTLQGPIGHGNGAWLLSGRRAFFDFYTVPITKRIRAKDGVDGHIKYSFYDLNAKLSRQLSDKNRLYFSFYGGKDGFADVYRQSRLYQDTTVYLGDEEDVNWGNHAASVRWTHRLGSSAFLNTSASYSRYFYESTDLVDLKVNSPESNLLRHVLLLKYNSNILDLGLRSEVDFCPSVNHQLKLGAMAARHSFQPGIVSFDIASQIDSILFDTLGEWNKQRLNSLEVSLYGQDEFGLGKKLSVVAGMRMGFLGVKNRIYFAPQPRLSMVYRVSSKSSVLASAGKVTQFVHLLSPTSVGLPKDLWVSATEIVPPQHSWQFSLGYQLKLNSSWLLDVESYYKQFQNLTIFKGTFLETVNASNWQDDVALGQGEAQGVELLLRKHSASLSGWIGYTLSWSSRQFDKEINKGEAFPFRLDRRHNLDLQLLAKLNNSWELALGFKLASGSAFTLPVLEYELVQPPGSPPSEIVANPRVVDQLNGQRLPAYHRLDISFTKSIYKENTLHKLQLGLTNLYNRKNPLYVTIRDKFQPNGELKREFVQVSLLPIFPTLRYVLKFGLMPEN